MLYVLERPGALLHGRVVREECRDAVLYLGGKTDDLPRWAERFDAHLPHRATCLVDHRGFGESTGEPSDAAMVPDALAVYDDLRTRHERVAVVGRSLGSGAAVQVAVARDVERLVLVTPFDSLAAVVRSLLPVPLPRLVRDRLPVQWVMSEAFDSAAIAHRITAPTLVLRAGRDQAVLPARTDRLVARLPSGAEVVAFADADHASIAERDDYWRAISTFLP